MCLTSDAVYRIRDADAIFRIERKDDQKIAQNSKLFYRKYFEFANNHSGSVRGTLWRIVSKYILFFCAWFSHFTVGTCRTRRITVRVPRKITTDHDMRPIRLTWKSQIDAVCKKLIFVIFRLSGLRPHTHWQFYPTREPFANGSRRVARVHTASTASGSSGTLRPHQDVFAVDADGSRLLVSAV